MVRLSKVAGLILITFDCSFDEIFFQVDNAIKGVFQYVSVMMKVAIENRSNQFRKDLCSLNSYFNSSFLDLMQ